MKINEIKYEIAIPKNNIVQESLLTFPLLRILTLMMLNEYLIIYNRLKTIRKIFKKETVNIILKTFIFSLVN